MYERLKEGGDFNTPQVSGSKATSDHSYFGGDAENEINKLHKRISHLEKENRDLMSKITNKQNSYETMIQKNNLATGELDTLKLELNRLNSRHDALNNLLNAREKRNEALVKEREEQNKKLKELELKVLEDKYGEATKEIIENLKSENEVFKKIIKDSNNKKNSEAQADLLSLQKKEADYIKEIEMFKQKIYAYKQMLKEYDILLSIVKEEHEEDSNMHKLNKAVDVDDIQIEELMRIVKHHIQSCIQRFKSGILGTSNPPKTMKTESIMEERVKALDKDKQELLDLFSRQEGSYKSTIDHQQQELDKLKENLSKALEDKSHLETKIQHVENTAATMEASYQKQMEECTERLKELEEKVQARNKETEEVQAKLIAAQQEITKLELGNQNEKDQLEQERQNIKGEVTKLETELKTIKDELRVAEERLKLKEEEIYEMKENYEAQIEDMVIVEDKPEDTNEFIRIIPYGSESKKIGSIFKKDTEEAKKETTKKASLKHKELQDKIHNLCDRLFTARDTIIEREAEINTLKDQLRRKEISENDLQGEVESHKATKKQLQDEIVAVNKVKEEMNLKLMELQKKFEEEKTELSRKLQASTSKVSMLMKEVESLSSNAPRGERLTPDTNKLIAKLIYVLRKSKKVHELKENELNDLKKQLMESVEGPQKTA